MAGLNELSESALVRVLTEPKNALIKQFQKLLLLDNIALEFTKKALKAIAKEAKGRKSGARGLRSVLEKIMLDIMYELPSKKNIKKCIIDENVINKGQKPKLRLLNN